MRLKTENLFCKGYVDDCFFWEGFVSNKNYISWQALLNKSDLDKSSPRR